MSYTLETLPVGLTGSFGADRLRDMLAAAQKGAVGELPVVSEASGPTLVGFPAVGSQEHGLGIFWSRLLVGGVYEPVLWVRPTKACFVGGAACDWVGFPVVLETGNYQAFELGYLYQGSVLKQEASPLALTPAQLEAALVIAIAGSNPKDTLDDVLNPWSVNPANVKAILSYVAPLTSNIQWDASGNAGFLHNVQVMGGLTVDGPLNANGTTLNTLNVTNEAEFGSTTTLGDSVVNGNQTVMGYVKAGAYEFDDNLIVTLSSELSGDGFSVYYSHARVSNGKLNIVIAISASKPTSAHSLQNGLDAVLTGLPTSVMDKLYANPTGYLDVETKQASYIDSAYQPVLPTAVQDQIEYIVAKNPDNLQLISKMSTQANTGFMLWRFEFNFILS